jgi:hypothetical protein
MKTEQARAGAAHERVMLNLAIFNLLLPAAALSSGYVSLFLTISLIGSAVMIFLIARRSRMASGVALIDEHWKLAWKRCRLLMISYAVATVIMLLGLLIASLQTDHNMFSIMLVVFTRIAAVPIVLMVLTLFVMSTTSLSRARQGEFPA